MFCFCAILISGEKTLVPLKTVCGSFSLEHSYFVLLHRSPSISVTHLIKQLNCIFSIFFFFKKKRFCQQIL